MGNWEKQIDVIPLAWGKAMIFHPHTGISPKPPRNLPKKVCSVFITKTLQADGECLTQTAKVLAMPLERTQQDDSNQQ